MTIALTPAFPREFVGIIVGRLEGNEDEDEDDPTKRWTGWRR